MKKYLVLILVFGLFISCGDSDEINNDETYYILTKMSGNIVGSETTGEAMEWQESICFYGDDTFKKIRLRDDEKNEVLGVYEIVTIESEEYLKLKYFVDNDLIASCYGDLTELLRINGDNLQGTWNHCDGPGLEYSKAIMCYTE